MWMEKKLPWQSSTEGVVSCSSKRIQAKINIPIKIRVKELPSAGKFLVGVCVHLSFVGASVSSVAELMNIGHCQ